MYKYTYSPALHIYVYQKKRDPIILDLPGEFSIVFLLFCVNVFFSFINKQLYVISFMWQSLSHGVKKKFKLDISDLIQLNFSEKEMK